MDQGWVGTKRMLWTVGMVFVVTFLTQVIASGVNVFSLDIGTLQAAINSAIMACAAWLVNYLNPNITQYGIGAPKE